MDFRTYRPAPEVLQQLAQFDFVAVVGPAAAGKTTLVTAAVEKERHLHAVVGDTSREPRPGEHEGVDYHFCNYPDMLRGIAARAYINVAAGLETHLYALNPARFKPGKVNLMPIWAKDVPYFRRLPFRRFSVIGVVPTDFEVWQERFSQRAFQPEEADRRMVEASQSFVFMLEDPDVKLVLNTTIAGASDDFITLACGRALPPRLQADQSRARQTLATLLQQLSRKKQLG